MFIQTEATPNPATLKFLPGRDVLGEGHVADFPNAEAGQRSPLAMRLFAVEGVAGVFFGSDFITVTKTDGEWQHLKPALLGAIMEHFTGGAPILYGSAEAKAPLMPRMKARTRDRRGDQGSARHAHPPCCRAGWRRHYVSRF